jgi:hypothetical protein
MTEDTQFMIGRVLRASTRGFSCGTHSTRIDYRHDFGAFVKAPIANDASVIVMGLIYSVEIKDDLLINELVMADSVDPNVLRDQRENRLIPVEISVINVGVIDQGRIVHSLPPRPPMSLSPVTLCTAEEVYEFTQSFEFFRLIVNASEVPSDDLMAAMLRYSSLAYPEPDRYEFMVRAGRHLGTLLSMDMKRLGAILNLIRP